MISTHFQKQRQEEERGGEKKRERGRQGEKGFCSNVTAYELEIFPQKQIYVHNKKRWKRFLLLVEDSLPFYPWYFSPTASPKVVFSPTSMLSSPYSKLSIRVPCAITLGSHLSHGWSGQGRSHVPGLWETTWMTLLERRASPFWINLAYSQDMYRAGYCWSFPLAV